MSTHDELALELFIADNHGQPRASSVADWEYFHAEGTFQGRVQNYKDMAAGAVAAGYSKPRTITTAEELDALPVESVVRSARGTIFEKANFHGDPEFPFWLTPGVNHEYAGIALALPATVLHEPEATA